MIRDHESRDLEAAAHLAYEADPYDDRPDPSEYADLDEAHLPRAGRRCWDCGVGSGPCQCTPEFAAWEAAQEEAEA